MKIQSRKSSLDRITNETKINLQLNLDGIGEYKFNTGMPFFDHMLSHVAKHSGADIDLTIDGDLEIDCHHSVEDTAIVMGQLLKQLLKDKAGIARYGHFTLPMDEVLTTVAVDFSGRPYFKYSGQGLSGKIGNYDLELTYEFLQKISFSGAFNLHVIQHYGLNKHHIHESIFKCFGRALKMAWHVDSSNLSIPSTKGVL